MDGLRPPRNAQTQCPEVGMGVAGDTRKLSFYRVKNSHVFSSFSSEGSQNLALCFSIGLFETCLAYMGLALQSQPALYMRLMGRIPLRGWEMVQKAGPPWLCGEAYM